MNVVLQIGQCGNQFGRQFFNTLAEAITLNKDSENVFDDTGNKFFAEDEKSDLFSRCILIDTEPKVIGQTLQYAKHQGTFKYREGNSIVKKEGSANNWAMGYFDHGPNVEKSVLELVRKEVEQCDHLQGFLMFMSVAGGTGSGLGTFLTEAIKDEFSSTSITNQVVFPFYRGEVTVQSYNALFTLSHLQKISDAVIMFENDQLFKICNEKICIKEASLSDLNTVAAQQLVSLIFPAKTSSGFPSFFGDILAHLVPHPQFKLINLRSVPQEPASCYSFSTYPWKSLLRSLRRMLLYNSIVEEHAPFNAKCMRREVACEVPVSIANLLLLRGAECDSANPECLHQPSLPYASWVPVDCRLKTWTHTLPLFKQQRIATLANNGQVPIPRIDEAVSKSWTMFNSKAYLHHYNVLGLSNDDILTDFMVVEQLVASYKGLRC